MPGPPDVVWDLITDWEHQDDWMLEASDFAVTSPQREGVGVEAEATVQIAGIKTRDRVRVAAWEPGEHLAIEHLGWVAGRGDIFLIGLGDDRTHVYWREELWPPGPDPFRRMGLALFKPVMARIFKRHLRVLRGLVRARAGSARAASARGAGARALG